MVLFAIAGPLTITFLIAHFATAGERRVRDMAMNVICE